MWILVYLPN
jgi:hypothetical protein